MSNFDDAVRRLNRNLKDEVPATVRGFEGTTWVQCEAKDLRLLLDEVGRLTGELPGKLRGERALAEEKIRCFLERVEKAEAELAGAKDAWQKDVDGLRAELAAERERAERQRVVLERAHGLLDCWNTTGGDCHNGSCPCCLVASDIEALRPAAPDPTPSEEFEENDPPSKSGPYRGSEQPDLPLGQEAKMGSQDDD